MLDIKYGIKQNSATEQLFIFTWTVYSAFYVIVNSSSLSYSYPEYAYIFSSISTFYNYITLFFLMIIFFYDLITVSNWNRSRFLFIAIFLIAAFVVEVKITDRNLMLLIMFILTAQAIDFDKLLRYDVKLKTILLAVILGLCTLGLLVNRSEIINGAYKMSFGFGHPNALACYVLTILAEFLCIKFKKMHWYDWAGILGVVTLVWEITKSRTSVYTFLIIIALYWIANYSHRLFRNKLIITILAVSPIAVASFSFFMEYLYSIGNGFAIKFNDILTGRLRLAYNALNVEGIKLFGQEINFSSFTNPNDNVTVFLVDNAYIRSALRWGAVITCMIIIFLMKQIIKLAKLNRTDILLLALFFIILGFAESYMINPFYNLSLLCLFGAPNYAEKNVQCNKLQQFSGDSSYLGKYPIIH